MSLLTEKEKAIFRGGEEGTPKQRQKAIAKLLRFQKKKSNPEYVNAVNQFIPIAEQKAQAAEKKHKDFNIIFHREMNRLTREAGIRNI